MKKAIIITLSALATVATIVAVGVFYLKNYSIGEIEMDDDFSF